MTAIGAVVRAAEAVATAVGAVAEAVDKLEQIDLCEGGRPKCSELYRPSMQ